MEGEKQRERGIGRSNSHTWRQTDRQADRGEERQVGRELKGDRRRWKDREIRMCIGKNAVS